MRLSLMMTLDGPPIRRKAYVLYVYIIVYIKMDVYLYLYLYIKQSGIRKPNERRLCIYEYTFKAYYIIYWLYDSPIVPKVRNI